MKFIFTLLLVFPIIAFAQNKVEEIQLKSGRTVVLYDNGLWIYKDVPLAEPKQTAAKMYQPASSPKSSTSQASSPCGARTKTTGAPCKRMVKGGGYCYQHS